MSHLGFEDRAKIGGDGLGLLAVEIDEHGGHRGRKAGGSVATSANAVGEGGRGGAEPLNRQFHHRNIAVGKGCAEA